MGKRRKFLCPPLPLKARFLDSLLASGGKDVVVARDLRGELGFIRIASDLDKERFPRLTSWSPK